MLEPLTLLVVSALSAAPAELPSERLFAPPTTLTVERLKIRSTGERAGFHAEPLRGRLVLSDGAALVAGEESRLCPRVEHVNGQTVLHCTSPRLAATLDRSTGLLTLVALRGVPWRSGGDGPPAFFYNPLQLAAPLNCPAVEPNAKAECDYRAGDLKRAFQEFSALGAANGFARLRLGDIALALNDAETGLGYFDEAAALPGPISMLAHLRRCELVDDCPKELLLAVSYPAVVRDEARLRLARWQAFRGEAEPVLAFLATDLPVTASPTACTGNAELCRRLLLAMLETESIDAQVRALQSYLTLPDRLHKPLAEELGDAAAEVAARLGVPRFGAHVLASVFPEVAPARRADHLLRTIDLYAEADDRAHAEAVAEFAKTVLPKATLRTRIWQQALRVASTRSERQPRFDPIKQEADVTHDVAEATRVKTALGGTQEAQR